MKYIWIIMLAVLYIIWLIYTIIDIKSCLNTFKPGYVLSNLTDASQGFIFINITVLFIVSLCKFLEVL